MSPDSVRDEIREILNQDHSVLPQGRLIDLIQQRELRKLPQATGCSSTPEIASFQMCLLNLARNCDDGQCSAGGAKCSALLEECQRRFTAIFPDMADWCDTQSERSGV